MLDARNVRRLRRRLGARYQLGQRALARPRGRERVCGVLDSVEDYVAAELGAPERYELVHAGGSIERPAPRTVAAEHPEFARLRRHEHPPAFRARLPWARIAGDVPVVLTRDRRAVLASALDREQLDANPVLRRRLHPPTRLDGTHVGLVSQWSRNFFHWMTDVLPRLSLVGDTALRETPVIVLAELEPSAYDALELVGVPAERLVHFDGTQLEVEELILPSMVGRSGNPPAWALRWLRERLGAVRRSPPGQGRRLYVSRADATWRRVVNEEEVAAVLDEHGFERILPGSLPLREQLAAFAEADAVVGAHGAGLVNLVAASGATVVELLPETWVNGCYYAMAAALELPYWYLVGDAAGGHDQRVDVEGLRRTLAAAGVAG